MAGPADATDQVETIQDVIRQLMAACLDHHRLGFVAIQTGELEPGEVFECRIRFGWGEKRPGDDSWPYVKRAQRNGRNGHQKIWTPRKNLLD